MQRREDDLEWFINGSFKEFEISDDYNERLLWKFDKSTRKKQISLSGICFITSGILLIALNLTNYYTKFFELQHLFDTKLNILFQNINKLLGV